MSYVAGSVAETTDAADGDANRILINGGSVDPAFDAVFAPGACDCAQTP